MGTARAHRKSNQFLALATLVVVSSAPAPALCVIGPEQFKPGFNLFKPEQDIEEGRKAAAETDKQLALIDDPEVLRYVNDLGRRLSTFAPNNRSYEWTFKVVNSPDINAFALPGGFIYVNRATIESAQNEAQLAGVMAHEEGHVVMRHATHRASQLLIPQLGLGILGGMLGQDSSLGGKLTEMGLNFVVGSALLKYSRDQEAEADAVGTYTLYHAGYDPHGMAQFFEIIQQKNPQQTGEYHSDHPVPEHRVEKLDAEIPQLGPPAQWNTDSAEFRRVKDLLLHLPAAPTPKPSQP